jgi:hypothetical protein
VVFDSLYLSAASMSSMTPLTFVPLKIFWLTKIVWYPEQLPQPYTLCIFAVVRLHETLPSYSHTEANDKIED